MRSRGRVPSQESEDTRSIILQAAEQIFAEKGYNGARVAEIAEKIGMDKRLIFYYFGTKQGLYAQILEEFFQKAGPLLGDFLLKRGEKIRQADLDRFLENMTDFIQRNRNPVRILFREFLDGGHLLETFLQGRILPIFELWRAYYPRLFPGGRKAAREADHVLLALSGMGLFYFLVQPLMEKVWGEDPLHPDRLAERKVFLRRLTEGMARTRD
jgi:AcrR family transcriptional regulator